MTKKWTREQLNAALKAIREDGATIREASVQYGVPNRTLFNHISWRHGDNKQGRKNSIQLEVNIFME